MDFQENVFWGLLVHVGYNMWCDRDAPEWSNVHGVARPYMRFDDALWNDMVAAMAEAGINLVVLDLGEGVRYESHPELAVQGSWSRARLKREIVRLREAGIEPIPKLNFSTAHDAWLSEYARAVSTNRYYNVCRDLIAEVCDLFGAPRFFHLGMDEETAEHQTHYAYAVMRQHELWWHDLMFYIEQVERAKSRAWVWSDYVWRHPKAFLEQMSKRVLQSNWYYGAEFAQDTTEVGAYTLLDSAGYDQVPTGSNWAADTNFAGTVEFCAKNLTAGHLLGFLQTSWQPTLPACRDAHFRAIEQVGEARGRFANH